VPTELDTSLVVADVYADALLGLANERNQADDVLSELQQILKLFRTDEFFAGFMSSSAVDDDDRRESIHKIFAGRVSEMVLNTLLVMNDHDRSGLVPFLVSCYKNRLDEQKGRQDVYVSSAVPLEDGERQNLRSVLTRLIGRQAVLVESVDEELIGGLVVRIADRQMDGSVRRKLATIRGSLAGRGEAELLAGKEYFEAPR
jgi:F-type H+-transporting ATPase subunit delta